MIGVKLNALKKKYYLGLTIMDTGRGFRQDINGLRAWAVVAVVLFHFSLLGVSGGFVGVDIFFVISGYLMTQIVLTGLESNRFSVVQFYMARVRRILPALMVVVLLLLGLGWFWLPMVDYQSLGAQSTYALSFLSNLYYWRTAGYFDVAAHEKWLLHTWSLGVEAQFYALFPLMVMIIWRIRQSLNAVIWLMAMLFVLSFSAMLLMTSVHSSASFYLLPTRLWELVAGGLVFLIATQVSAHERVCYRLGILGWLLILLSLFTIDASLIWPSYWTILPVLGASLVIFSANQQSVMTHHLLIQWIGTRSYSLYLWHWPLVVVLYFTQIHDEVLWIALAFSMSILLAALSFRFVETPTRRYLSQRRFARQFLLVLPLLVLLLIAAVLVKTQSFSDRLDAAVTLAAQASQDRPTGGCFVNDLGQGAVGCLISGDKTGMLLAGDSHSESVRSALDSAVSSVLPGHGVRYWGLSNCPTVEDALFTFAAKQEATSCATFNRQLLHTLWTDYAGIPLVLLSRTATAIHGYNGFDETPKGVSLMHFDGVTATGEAFNQYFTDKLVETTCALAQHRPVYLMRPIPEMGVDVPKTLSRRILFGLGNDDIKVPRADYAQRQRVIWAAQDKAAAICGVKILDPLPYLCDERFCYGSEPGRPLYYDDEHLSEYGNQRLMPLFKQVLHVRHE